MTDALTNPVAQLKQQLEVAHKLMQALLSQVGTPAYCKGCGAQIFFVTSTKTGKTMPYNPDGLSHFATCPKAEDFRKQGVRR